MEFTVVCDLCRKERVHVEAKEDGGVPSPEGWLRVKTKRGAMELCPLCIEAVKASIERITGEKEPSGG